MSDTRRTVSAVAERIELWWARRQFSRDADVPYPVGTYREEWAAYPVLIRQFHPDLNAGITLTQIPPAADVLLRWQCDAGHIFAATPAEQRRRPGRERRRSAWCPDCSDLARGRTQGPRARTPPRRVPPVCEKTPELPAGEPFLSECAPAPASAVEGRMRQEVFAALAVTSGLNAVRVAQPFFQHREVWPDLLLPELRVAIEYDSTGRHGLEHVGAREESDRRKDRLLRRAGWEVVRIRTGRLEPLGPHDLQLSAWNTRAMPLLLDRLRDIRGPLLVDAYLV